MGAKSRFFLNTHFSFVHDLTFSKEFMFFNMSSFWVLLRGYVYCLFHSIFKYFFRLKVDDNSENNELIFSDQIQSEQAKDGVEKTEVSEFSFRFQDPIAKKPENSASVNKYEFISNNDFITFLEEPKVMSFCVHEMFSNTSDSSIKNSDPLATQNSSEEEDFIELRLETEDEEQAKAAESGGGFWSNSVLDKDEQVKNMEFEISEEDNQNLEDEIEYLTDDDKLNSETEQDGSNGGFCKFSCKIDSFNSEIDAENDHLNHHDFSREDLLRLETQFLQTNPKTEEFGLSSRKDSMNSELQSEDITNGVGRYDFFHEDVSHLEPQSSESHSRKEEISANDWLSAFIPKIDSLSCEFQPEITSDENSDLGHHNLCQEDLLQLDTQVSQFNAETEEIGLDDEISKFNPKIVEPANLDPEVEVEDEDLVLKEEESEAVAKSEEPEMKKKSSYNNDDDDDEDDFLSEHEDLINQLKLELRNVRTGGLPTISEESETPKMEEDLKPLKIDVKFELKDIIEDIQKVYKSYSDRMRKLDILNYQTMHAIGFLQMKNSCQEIIPRKSSIPAMKSLLLQSLVGSKVRRIENEPPLKFIEELQRDLELVYIGQVCLSWEILYWQYRKSQELQEHDARGFRQYNVVAGEFQLFQVFLQRFIEDEKFQGPRISNYVKNRCVLRNLLQVPVIKEDPLKNKNIGKTGDEENVAVTSNMLTHITMDSLRIFSRFILSHREDNGISKGPRDPSISDSLSSIQKDLHKKEKKLKEILRSGNCIVKKFQKNPEDGHEGLFVAQVELKLVSMVLNMSKLTRDRLIWCDEKLGKIRIIGRKIQLEPSFLLFPC